MTPIKTLTGAAAVLGLVFFITASVPQAQAPAAGPQAPAQAPPAAPAPGGAPVGAQAPGGGGAARGGGGRGNPAAPLFAEQCAGCHGADLAGGRAPSLFDPKWLGTVDDAKMTAAIKNGVPNTEMEAFKALTDDQIFQLIAYIRSQTFALQPRPTYVPDAAGAVLTTEKATVRVEVLTKDVNTPWALAFLPDGRMLITERNGNLRILDKANNLSEPVKNVPKAHVQQDGGMLDVELHPQYAQNGWVYLSYSEVVPGYVPPPPPPPAPAAAAAPAPAPATAAPAATPAAPAAGAPAPGAPPAAGAAPAGAQAPGGGGGGRGGGRGGAPNPPSMTVVVRGKINANNEWTDQQTIFRAPAELYTPSGAHFGTRLIFDNQNHLFFAMGDRNTNPNPAQLLTSPLGKVHRFNDDGTIPKDNPFVNTPGAIGSIWTYGHRNPEGLAWEPGTGALWSSEHGPNSADEINILVKGHNYGWNLVSKQGPPTYKVSEASMDDPIVYFTPTLAPAGISFYTGTRYPGWRNTSLFVGGLGGQRLMRLEVAGGKVTKQEVIFNQFGRVRDIVQGPDGLLYVALQSPGPGLASPSPGSVVRLVPQ